METPRSDCLRCVRHPARVGVRARSRPPPDRFGQFAFDLSARPRLRVIRTKNLQDDHTLRAVLLARIRYFLAGHREISLLVSGGSRRRWMMARALLFSYCQNPARLPAAKLAPRTRSALRRAPLQPCAARCLPRPLSSSSRAQRAAFSRAPQGQHKGQARARASANCGESGPRRKNPCDLQGLL